MFNVDKLVTLDIIQYLHVFIETNQNKSRVDLNRYVLKPENMTILFNTFES